MIETEIEKRISSGDESALGEFIEEYSPVVAAVVYNISRGALTGEDIEEIVSDAFLSVWLNRDKIIENRLKGYICCIAKNKARNRMKQIGRNIPESIEEHDPAGGLTVAAEAEKRALGEILEEAISQLEQPDREIFLRHDYYYQTAPEISEIMGINLHTVNTKIQRTRKKLKKYLQERGVE